MDYTPGYGSVAPYWAWTVQCLEEEYRGSTSANPVLVAQNMGRLVGSIPAARLAYPTRESHLLILFAEVSLSPTEITDLVADTVRKHGRAIVIGSEGLKLGEPGERKDAFDHAALSLAQIAVAQLVMNHLNEVGLPAQGLARGQVPDTGRRDAIFYSSPVDIAKAYQVGKAPISVAAEEKSGVIVTIRPASGPAYRA